ncbi:MAG: hypothetical protein K5672_02950 [Bacteroidaceae bacterium]|nr:hypothetical protein [Bacteroidaceae bacterium]
MKRQTTTFRKMLMAAAIVTLPMVMNAQIENPRGIYKMITLTGRMGEVNSPWDMYKVCTDSVTLTVRINKDKFTIGKNDKSVFNYTGPEPKDENDKSTLIYDSNADHFSEKWWSDFDNHLYFPKDDWCIEKYESNKYSDVGRSVFDIITATPTVNQKNPIIGTWRVIGWMDELKDVKNQLKALQEAYEDSKYRKQHFVITPTKFVPVYLSGICEGYMQDVRFPSKNTIFYNGKTVVIKWLSKDIIAMEVKIDYRTDWQILERETGAESLLSRVASLSIKR